ncbi:universal stress protein [Streptomyces sp. NPDC001922]|uniref:universal stress protein n=1 Tax=Streptomyces sp. NPDC001922 TaxID=3364624 RepID=UPI0036AB796F
MEDVVTVGLDGSGESMDAARWAADEADRRNLTLRLLHAWVLLSPDTPGAPQEKDQNYWAKRIVGDAQREITHRHPDLSIVEELLAEDATEALLRAAADSRILVLGSRGLERVESFFLGDTGLHVVARADRPVVLVRAGAAENRPPGDREAGVVAGVSLEGACDSVLDFACDTAAARGVPVHVVHGRSLPVQAYVPWGVDPDAAKEIRDDVQRDLAPVLGPWREKFPALRIVEDIRLESPARAVVRAARSHQLLVVGRRRHRQALGPRLGPVAQAAVHHANGPVAVVSHD